MRFVAALALPAFVLGACRDPVEALTLPAVGDRFALTSVDGSPLPWGELSGPVLLADTIDVLASAPDERILQQTLVVEGLANQVIARNYAVGEDGVLRFFCPINAICNFSVIEGRLVGNELTVKVIGPQPREFRYVEVPSSGGNP